MCLGWAWITNDILERQICMMKETTDRRNGGQRT